MAAILNSAILNLAILDSGILVYPLKFTHTCQDWFPPFAQKKIHSHFPPHHLHKKNFTHSFRLNLIDGGHLEFCHIEFFHLGFSFCIVELQTSCFLLSESLKNTLLPLWLWHKLIQFDSHLMMAAILNSAILHKTLTSDLFNLTQTHSLSLNLMMAAILISAILNLYTGILKSAILVFHSQTLTHTCQDWFPPFEQKKPSLIHSHWTWWWQPSWILPCWIQTSAHVEIQTPCYLLSDTLKNTIPLTLTLTQTNSFWLKHIHSHSTWWWQPSWILPSWIWPSWIQPS